MDPTWGNRDEWNEIYTNITPICHFSTTKMYALTQFERCYNHKTFSGIVGIIKIQFEEDIHGFSRSSCSVT